MSTAAVETWENTYSGLDVNNGYTGWVMRVARLVLPDPVISPTCAKRGHKWGAPFVVMSRDAPVRGCERCARRGLVVLQTTGLCATGDA